MQNNVGHPFAAVAKHWGWYLALGILMVITGSFALYYSTATTLLSVLYLGAFLIIGGGIEAIQALRMKQWKGFFLHAVIAVIYFFCGIFMLVEPMRNALALTLFLSIVLVAIGIFRIIFSLSTDLPHWGWLLLNGIISIILGVLIFKEWPVSGLWVIGMFVAIELIFTGWTWIMVSARAKQLHKA